MWPRVGPLSGRRPVALVVALLSAFALVATASADDNTNYQISDGLGVYLGLMPAAIIGEHPPNHAEAGMHGGPPINAHAYHIIVAVFDATSGGRVENAAVTAVVSGLGHVGATNLALEPMLINDTVTYGAFVDLAALERFDVAVSIKIPGQRDPVRVSFANEHVP